MKKSGAMRSASTLLLSAGVVVMLDVWTKQLAERGLGGKPPVSIIGEVICFRLGTNSGVAFGLCRDCGGWVLVISALGVGVLTVLLLLALKKGLLRPAGIWPVGVLLGGGIANLVDRFPDGLVTDFIDIGTQAWRFPTFNVADVAVTLGMAWLLGVASRKRDDAANVNDCSATDSSNTDNRQ